MKRTYFFLSAFFFFLAGVSMTSCEDDEDAGGSEGLSIKVYSPTKVIEGQVVTITGTALDGATAVEFPGGVSVSDIRHTGTGLLTVVTPAGIAAGGGELIVRAGDQSVAAPVPLTIGHPAIATLSPGDEAKVGNELIVTGTDMEFFTQAVFPGTDGEVVVNAIDFERISTSLLRIKVPRGIAEGRANIRLLTVADKEYLLPEINLIPQSEGEWVTVETTVWEGEHDLSGWGNNFNIKAAWFEGLEVGQTVKFYFTQYGGNPQFKFNTGEWGAFAIPEAPELDGGASIVKRDFLGGMDVTEFSFAVTEDIYEPWFTTGDGWGNGDAVILNGEGFVFTKIVILKEEFIEGGGAAPEILAWEGEEDLSGWGNNFSVKAAWFEGIKAGNIVTLYFTQYGGSSQFKFNSGEWGAFAVPEAPELDGGSSMVKRDFLGGIEVDKFSFTVTEELYEPWFTTGDGWGNGDAFIINGEGFVFTKITFK
ncbi:MAG: hypothetical protein LBS88_05205 [Tannerellaceae bacterium]|jgi:hypothetical protein|nr:hypothetical protein [Tannerellaceae bacterium]